jgi:acyl-homoserine lactone synthase
MTDIHLVTAENRAAYEAPMEQFHRRRHEVFVEERGWHGLARDDRRDVDAYDNDNAVYLLAIDNGRVVGGLRLYPTLLPHMLSETFPHLALRTGVLRGPTIFECTRYFTIRERRMGRTDCRLLAAFQDLCLQEGITAVTAVVEMWWLPRWQQAGFTVRPLGLPALVGGQPCIAASILIREESLTAVRRIAGLKGATFQRHGPRAPLLARMSHAAA